MTEIEVTKRVIPCELALLSMGFTQPIHQGLLDDLGLKYDNRGNVVVDKKFSTSTSKVFAAGDYGFRSKPWWFVPFIPADKLLFNVDEYLKTI